MLCSISGEQLQVPVASRKSGNVFEKRLIDAYLTENGNDPITGDNLTAEDLIELRSERIVRPRPPTQTSVPALLATFQNEWDAIALETFELKKQLAQARQELSTALYTNDGAVRLIARLMKERDDARNALAKVQLGAGAGAGANPAAAAGSDEMEVDSTPVSPELPADIAAHVEQLHEELRSKRRKRPIPNNWFTPTQIETLVASKPTWLNSKASLKACATLSADKGDDEAVQTIVYGSEDGSAVVSRTDGSNYKINVGSRIRSSAIWNSKPIIAASDGSITLFDNGDVYRTYKSHAGPVTGLSLHPCGYILASVGVDGSYNLYDLRSSKPEPIARVFTKTELTACEIHPDGRLFGIGGADGDIKIFNLSAGTLLQTLPSERADADGPIQSISFSENGYFLASASQKGTEVTIWDLRKQGDDVNIKTIDFGAAVTQVQWDYTGQFLAVVGGGSLAVEYFQKSSKTWNELFRRADKAKRVMWDPLGQHLFVDGAKGIVEYNKQP